MEWIDFGTQGLDMGPKGWGPIKGYSKEFRGMIEQKREAQEVQSGLEKWLDGDL